MSIKTFKMKVSNLKVIMLSLALATLIAGCDDRFETIQPPGIPDSKATVTQAKVGDVNIYKTNDFFKLAANNELGDKVGLFELRKEGILIHPGETTPSKISLKLSRTFQKLSIRPFIAVLPAEALSIKEAGTVGVEFFLDGKSGGRLLVNRDTRLTKELDLTNVDTLTIAVDNADGKAWFDWLMLGVVDSK